MPSNNESTYLERLQKRFRNNPVIAWFIVAATLVLSVSAFVTATKSLISELEPGDDEPRLNIVLEAYDPRFGDYQEDGKRMNWGGGSQMLFVETANPVDLPDPPADGSGQEGDTEVSTFGLLNRLAQGDEIRRVWEVIPRGDADGMRIKVNAVYDAARDAATCVILEWGVWVEEAVSPANGVFLSYTTGGAYASPTGGVVRIGETTGGYEITLWQDEEHNRWDSKRQEYIDIDEADRPKTQPAQLVQYLTPGEPAFLDINAVAAGENQFIDNPKPAMARILKVYARVLVEGKEWVIESRNSVQLVALNGFNDWQTEDDHEIEDLRSRAYIAVE